MQHHNFAIKITVNSFFDQKSFPDDDTIRMNAKIQTVKTILEDGTTSLFHRLMNDFSLDSSIADPLFKSIELHANYLFSQFSANPTEWREFICLKWARFHNEEDATAMIHTMENYARPESFLETLCIFLMERSDLEVQLATEVTIREYQHSY